VRARADRSPDCAAVIYLPLSRRLHWWPPAGRPTGHPSGACRSAAYRRLRPVALPGSLRDGRTVASQVSAVAQGRADV